MAGGTDPLLPRIEPRHRLAEGKHAVPDSAAGRTVTMLILSSPPAAASLSARPQARFGPTFGPVCLRSTAKCNGVGGEGTRPCGASALVRNFCRSNSSHSRAQSVECGRRRCRELGSDWRQMKRKRTRSIAAVGQFDPPPTPSRSGTCRHCYGATDPSGRNEPESRMLVISAPVVTARVRREFSHSALARLASTPAPPPFSSMNPLLCEIREKCRE
jgi:hypothetical protein